MWGVVVQVNSQLWLLRLMSSFMVLVLMPTSPIASEGLFRKPHLEELNSGHCLSATPLLTGLSFTSMSEPTSGSCRAREGSSHDTCNKWIYLKGVST